MKSSRKERENSCSSNNNLNNKLVNYLNESERDGVWERERGNRDRNREGKGEIERDRGREDK
jgi:hypothetical protein